MLAAAYQATLRRWMTNVSILAFLFVAVGTWQMVYSKEIQVLFVATFAAIGLVATTFSGVTIYFLVIGYLTGRPAPAAWPKT